MYLKSKINPELNSGQKPVLTKEGLKIVWSFCILLITLFSSCSSSYTTSHKPRKMKSCGCPKFTHAPIFLPTTEYNDFFQLNGIPLTWSNDHCQGNS